MITQLWLAVTTRVAILAISYIMWGFNGFIAAGAVIIGYNMYKMYTNIPRMMQLAYCRKDNHQYMDGYYCAGCGKKREQNSDNDKLFRYY